MSSTKSKEYQRYLNNINRDVVANIDTLDSNKLKSIINKYPLDIKDSILLFTVLSAITTIINNQRMTVKKKEPLLPIIAVIGIYSVLKPKRLAENIIAINKNINLTPKQLKVKKLLDVYYKDNEKAINSSIKKATSLLDKNTRKATTTTAKYIRKDLHTMVSEKKLTIDQMETTLRRKYTNNEVAIERTIDTELHAQSELVKLEVAKGNGLTHKTWKTQEDSKVRKTSWHNSVANKRIPIDSEFRASGLHATQPGDSSLPAGDRIRCRCYLIYD